jgi:hypothetical protein
MHAHGCSVDAAELCHRAGAHRGTPSQGVSCTNIVWLDRLHGRPRPMYDRVSHVCWFLVVDDLLHETFDKNGGSMRNPEPAQADAFAGCGRAS